MVCAQDFDLIESAAMHTTHRQVRCYMSLAKHKHLSFVMLTATTIAMSSMSMSRTSDCLRVHHAKHESDRIEAILKSLYASFLLETQIQL